VASRGSPDFRKRFAAFAVFAAHAIAAISISGRFFSSTRNAVAAGLRARRVHSR
jgi:hypothetical protein